MNIVLITGMFPPMRTGTSFFSYNLANALVECGHDVTVFTLADSASTAVQPKGQLQSNARIRSIPCLRLPIPIFKHFRVCALFPTSYRELLGFCRQEKPDAILLVNQYLDIAFPAVFVSRSCRIPIYCIVGTQIQSNNSLINSLMNLTDRLICGRLIYASCTKIFAWDGEIVRYLTEVHGNALRTKVAISGYGVHGDLTELSAIDRDYSIRNQIIGIGAVIPQRNYLQVIKTFALVADEFPQLCLKIVGHVYLKNVVDFVRELGLENRVIFSGELPHSEVVRELKNSDLFWAPPTGRYTGLGTATVEAMASGLPTFLNADECIIGQPKLKDMEHAVLTLHRSNEELASLLRIFLTDVALRRRVGSSGRSFARAFRWDQVASRIGAVIGESSGAVPH